MSDASKGPRYCRTDYESFVYAAKLSDAYDMGVMTDEQWDVYEDVFPEASQCIVGMYDASMCVLFLAQMARTGDLGNRTGTD